MSSRGVEIDALQPVALAATRAAAVACQSWIGRGCPKDADAAATEAMRAALAYAPGSGTVVIGEGEKDEAPMLYEGERVGLSDGPAFDIAVDPLEGTELCASGMPGSLATIAFAEPDAMASLGRAFYMDKLVGPPALRGALDIAGGPESNVAAAAEALGKPIEALRVVVLDKPRHAELIERVRRAGARVTTPSEGDVAEGLAAGLPEGGADLLMGVGGTPEGVMSACAARALGGFMQGRLAPQGADESAAVAEAGLDTDRIYGLDDLVGGDGFFVATGVTGGELLRRPWQDGGHLYTESIVVAAGSVRRVVEATKND
ncbi:MAG: fructose-bisphosphatase class II family protein [Thermoleophilaceae bacterium]